MDTSNKWVILGFFALVALALFITVVSAIFSGTFSIVDVFYLLALLCFVGALSLYRETFGLTPKKQEEV